MQHKAVVDDAYFPRSRPEAAWCPPISHQLTCCAVVHPVFPEQNPTMSLLNPVDTHGNMNWLLLSTLLSSFQVVFCPMFPEKDHLRRIYMCQSLSCFFSSSLASGDHQWGWSRSLDDRSRWVARTPKPRALNLHPRSIWGNCWETLRF